MKKIFIALSVLLFFLFFDNSSNSIPVRASSSTGWQATSLVNAPFGRENHTAIWTGKEMIIWGGNNNGGPDIGDYPIVGAKYNPANNTWQSISIVNAPLGRQQHTAIWTGKEMIIWGGNGGGNNNIGARYNPETDTWITMSAVNAPSARILHSAVWSGTEMIVWGGADFADKPLNDGAKYNPETDIWTSITTAGAPSGRRAHKAVWTGNEMVVWGGGNAWIGAGGSSTNTGGRYNPNTNTWTTTALSGAPAPISYLHSMIWTGNEVVVVGSSGVGMKLYNPSSDSWRQAAVLNAPDPVDYYGAVWTGKDVIVWGGTQSPSSAGGRYNLSLDTWTPLSKVNAPVWRAGPTAVWTGNEMVVWGGFNPPANSGGLYSTPICLVNDWMCGDWNSCSAGGEQTRTCNKVNECEGGVTPPLATQTCTYIPPICSSWSYSGWNTCSVDGKQTRTVLSSSPSNCDGGNPVINQSCTFIPICTADTWSCGDWNVCSASGAQTRSCTKTFDCSTVATPSPATAQSCAYVPPAPVCTADIWECDTWNTCSASGIQSRSCRRTFDCPNVQTATPASDQFCEAPYRPQPTIPNQSEEIVNQSAIIKSTVKLLCPVDEKSASQGSGTVIDSKGTILTNKHVVAGTLGCLVGFINDFDDEPYFGERQIADIIKTSPTQDIAILKIRNPKNKSLSYVDTTRGASNFSLGTKITTYGYPAKFGTKITYTSGDFSGTDASYLKTTAILEYGNSGGGAYLKNGTFIGVPSAVVKGELNALGYILSINTINAWLSNSSIASNSSNNQFSRVSVLENIDLKKLDTLNLFIPNGDEGGFPDVSKNHQNITAIKFLKERKIVNGYPDGTFKPEGTVNRAELLTILVNAKIGKPDENQYKNCFPDVKTEWFAPYVCYAKNAGWVKGYPDGKYRPGQTVNKVEALTILLNSQSISTSSSLTSKPFNDVNTTDWFAKYVSKAKEMGILEETGNTLSPGEGMRRAGISEILYRMLK